MKDDIIQKELTEEEGKEILRRSYQFFKEKDYFNTLKILDPVLNENKTINSKIFTTSLLWSIAGDSFYLLNEIDSAIDAYRKSIEEDEYSSAIPAYACIVAKHRIVTEATNAYEKLMVYDKFQKGNPKRWRFLAFIVGILFMRGTWWLLHVKIPFAKRRLKQMIKTTYNK